MAERNEKHEETPRIGMQQIVERALARALQEHIPQLQAQIAQRVLEALPAATNEVPATGHEDSGALVHAVANIHAGTTQKEILRALLDAGSAYCARTALF